MTADVARNRLMAILAADGVGFSRLMSLDDRSTVASLDAARNVFRAQVEAFGGRVVDMAGDSILAAFDTATGAVQAAMATQRQLAAEAETIPSDRRMPFRIGIHLGDVIEKADGTVYGDGVNIAARLQSIAEPGRITVSQAVQAVVQGRVEATFADIGDQIVKNIARPVRAYQIQPALTLVAASLPATAPAKSFPRRHWRVAAGAVGILCALVVGLVWIWSARTSSTTPAAATAANVIPLSIVVLPFTNLTGDPGQDYLADGLTATLTSGLSRIESAVVIDAATAQSVKGKAQTAQQIGKTLGVRFVLQGSVQRSGNEVRINAQLADTNSNMQLWTESFEGDTSDLFALQERVTSRIASSMHREMVVIAARESERRKDDPQAADFILRARALTWRPGTLDNWRKIEQLYRQALAVDPGNVNATMGIAVALAFQANNHGNELPAGEVETIWSEAARLAAQVNEVDPKNPSYYQVMAFHALYHGDTEGGRRAAEALLRLEPMSTRARNILGSIYLDEGKPDKAIELLTQAVNLTPKDAAPVFRANLGFAHLMAGNYKAAISWFDQALEINPKLTGLHRRLAVALALDGNEARARAEAKEYLRLNPGSDRDVGSYRARVLDGSRKRSPGYAAYVEEKEIPTLRKLGLLE